MRHIAILLVAVSAAGCVSLTPGEDKSPGKAPTLASTPRPPVRAELVTLNNAQKQSQALQDELDRELQEETAGSASPR